MNASSNATRELEDVKVMEKEKTMHASRHATRGLKTRCSCEVELLDYCERYIHVRDVNVIGILAGGVIDAI